MSISSEYPSGPHLNGYRCLQDLDRVTLAEAQASTQSIRSAERHLT